MGSLITPTMEHQAGLVPNRTGKESRQIVVRFGDTVTTKGTTPINSFGVKSCVIQETARAVKLGFYAPARGRAAVKATASGSEQSTIKVMSQRIASSLSMSAPTRSAAWRIGLSEPSLWVAILQHVPVGVNRDSQDAEVRRV
jgi:hypothetical protein